MRIVSASNKEKLLNFCQILDIVVCFGLREVGLNLENLVSLQFEVFTNLISVCNHQISQKLQ